MLSRRTLLGSAAAAATLPLVGPGTATRATAATPKTLVAMAKQIDDIVGAFDPANPTNSPTTRSAATSTASW